MRTIISALAVLCALASQADTYDERIPFVVLSGNEYIDTEYVPHCRNTRVVARLMILERPESPAGLMGTFASVDKSALNDVDSRNWAITVGKDGTKAYVIRPNVAGSISNGYFYPTSNSYDDHAALILEFVLAHGSVNGSACAWNSATGKGYYDDNRPDERLGPNCTFFVGDVNNSVGNPSTAPNNRLKARWFGLEIYENDELVRNFVPAKKGGVAGLFDTVTERFVTSPVGSVKGPQGFTLKDPGSAAVNFESGLSYIGGKAPGYDGVITVPANTTIYARYEDMLFLRTIGGIDLVAETSRFVVTNGSFACNMYTRLANGNLNGVPCGNFFGKGIFENRESVDSVGERALFLMGDCMDFSGNFIISNAAVQACTRWALGGPNAHVYYNSNNGKSDDRRRFTIRDSYMPATIHYVCGDNLLLNAGAGTYTNTWYFENARTMAMPHGNGTVFALAGNVYTTHDSDQVLYLQAGAHFVGPGEKYVNNMMVHLNQRTSSDSNKKLHPLGARVHCYPKAWNGGITQFTNFRISEQSYVTCSRADCFDPWASLIMRWVEGKDSDCRFDLNGYDQQIGFLGAYISNWTFPADHDPNCSIYSFTPASLTIYEGCVNNTAQADSWRTTFPGVVQGQATIVLNATNTLRSASLRKEIAFVSPSSDTTGGLIARKGTIRLWAQAAFPNLTKLEITDEGCFDIRTSNIGHVGGQLFVNCTNLTETAKINLASGVRLRAHTAYVNGRWLAAGTYGSEDAVAASGIPDAKVLSCLSGLGLMTVDEYGSHRQGFKVNFYR